MDQIKDRNALKFPGWGMVLVSILLLISGIYFLTENILVSALLIIAAIIGGSGFIIVNPNEARVLTFLGKYNGSVLEDGFFWVNPFASKRTVSLRIHNFESSKLKVNDADGNPIEIAAVVVWKVVDAAKAVYDVENYANFVGIQSETAIRSLASHYPYDSHNKEIPSLLNVPEEVGESLRDELHNRLQLAGVKIIEARISHLAYSPEIAQVMLRRQQAQAVVSARKQIVAGAMGMVEEVLERLEKSGVVQLDHERKAAMANNLMVALVSEGQTTPVINTGTLYT